MIEFLKLIFSKDFIANSKEIIAVLRRSKDWRKDIVKYSGVFFDKEKIESTVLIEESLKILKVKNWDEEEISETKFILNELLENSFTHGLPSKENSCLKAEITATSSFIKISISDFGLAFDLLKELNDQEAFNPNSDKHKGLSLINKITPEIYQEKGGNSNTIIVIKRQGLKPLKVEKENDILIFRVGNSTYINDTNFNIFVERLNSLASGNKIIIDFGSSRNMMLSRAYRDIRQSLVTAKIHGGIKIVVCGLENSPFVIKDYFEAKFPTFDTYEEALAYHYQ
jgi:anti-sigma regulatory factor (Ser/Thr protein kinase)